ncbi:MAG: hypothetical protein KDC99_17320 [Cyclobacteriaceae bacterium]|nr:hypothetical protein [Cyclobacteriaceae bacterium]
MKKILLIGLLLQIFSAQVSGQDQPAMKKIKVKKGQQVILKDTVFVTKNDTTFRISEEEIEQLKIKEDPQEKADEFYEELEEKSSKSKLAEEIFDFVVREKGRKEQLISRIIKSERVFEPYDGYTIRSIVFKSVDLLEGSVVDTLRKATTKLGKLVNRLHADTRAAIVEQNLLFDEGDKVDPYQLADNERLLREFKTLRDARIYLAPAKDEPETVDVVVVTQDVTSIGASGSYSSGKKFRLDVYDINILGYAKQLQVSYFKNALESPRHGYEITLRDQNFFRSFLQTELQYTNNYLRKRSRITVGRDFFTPGIKYAGGIDLYDTQEKFYHEEYDTLETPYRERNIDVWAGRSFKLQRRLNFIASARINNKNLTERPFVAADSNSFFFNRTLALFNFTLTKRNFLKSNRINGFGKTEDIPIGGSINLTTGRQFREFSSRNYLEVGGTFQKYYSELGYIDINVTAGSFFNGSRPEDGVIRISGLYFSDLFKIRKMQVRQFVYYNYTRGINRILDKSVSLDGKWETSDEVIPFGKERMSVSFETVYFLPWNAYRFQFAVFHRFDFNLLTRNELFSRESIFPAARLGIRTLNESLVLPTLSLEVGYYGRNSNYLSAWEIKISTTLPRLFGTAQFFKPRVTSFN